MCSHLKCFDNSIHNYTHTLNFDKYLVDKILHVCESITHYHIIIFKNYNIVRCVFVTRQRERQRQRQKHSRDRDRDRDRNTAETETETETERERDRDRDRDREREQSQGEMEERIRVGIDVIRQKVVSR